jgi:signal transduction histidine kinase
MAEQASKPGPKGKAVNAAFTVDTQLFRELGELLVGRDATALLELVKNAYDADATIVNVAGQRVRSKRGGSIVVTDDGSGMTLAEFRKGFLRLAGRSKVSGDRRSARFGRRYTGEKGVGRLATHKLARVIDIDSVPYSESGQRRRGVRAHMDWTSIERRSTMASAGKSMGLESYLPPIDRIPGTEITLSRLRHAWSEEELADFVTSAESFSPPDALLDSKRLGRRMVPPKPLLKQIKMRDQNGEGPDPGFRVNLAGDFSFGGEQWDKLIDSAEWVLEINARPGGVKIVVTPTEREVKNTRGHARRQTFQVSHPDPQAGPFFHSRIVARSRSGTKDFRNWSVGIAGIRVYSEGFRVLPYGSPDNDWLETNRDYAARSRKLRLVEENRRLASEINWDDEDDDAALTILPADSYVGAICLTRERSGELEMLVNREGFVPNRAFANLKDLTRLGTSVLTRARAAGRLEKREAARAAREERAVAAARGDEGEIQEAIEGSWRDRVGATLERTRNEVVSVRADVAAGNTQAAEQKLAKLEEETENLTVAITALIAEQRLTPILASVGIQMGEFVHEINGLLAMASTVDTVLGRLREDRSNFPSSEARRTVAGIQQTVGDLRARLERQAAYLIDLTSPTAVRRRSRQRLSSRLDRAAELVRPALDRREIKFTNRISDDTRTSPMFPAELTAVLLNLLTNAIKAAGNGGKIKASASQRNEAAPVKLRIENTGVSVNLDEDTERWFRPFETTTVDVDPLLGQGMGFGLPITRDILDEYGAEIDFVVPRKGYATAIQVVFPK